MVEHKTGQVVGSYQGFLEYDNGYDLFGSCVSSCCSRAQWNGRNAELTSDCSTLHPHARAAAPPQRPLIFLISDGPWKEKESGSKDLPGLGTLHEFSGNHWGDGKTGFGK